MAGVFTSYPLPGGLLESAAAITPGPDGALWFTGKGIGRITIAGAITEYPLPTPDSGPASIVAGPDGALWFTEGIGNRIGRSTTTGVITEYPIPTAGSWPQSITAGPDGALWFVEFAANRIGRITTAGAITEYAVPTADSWPQAIASGPDGALWFTECSSNQIGRVSVSDKSLSIDRSGPFPPGTVGVPYPPFARLFTATGGTAPYTWTATGLPSGMTLSSSGFLSGTPAVSGTFELLATVQDSSNPKLTASTQFAFTINSGEPLAILTTSPLPGGTGGAAYSFSLSATGGTLPYDWSVVGSLPAGLSLNTATGLISGTPTAQGSSSFTVQVADHTSATATLALTLNIGTSGSSGSGGQALSRSGVFSQVAAGGGWKSSLYFNNPSPAPVAVTLNFRDNTGAPLWLPWTIMTSDGLQSLSAASLSETIAPNATMLIETNLQQSVVSLSGWADVLSVAPIQGYGVFHYTSTAGIQSEGTIPLETAFQPSFLMPYDNLNGLQTAVALTNLTSGGEASLAATVWGESGAELAVQTIKLPAGGHISAILADLFPVTTANRGMIQFRSISGSNVTGLGLRVDPLGGITSIPKSLSAQ